MTNKIPLTVSKGSVDVPGRLAALDRTERHAVLATVAGAHPFASLVAYALTPDLKGVVFATPRETGKYRNILRNASVALLIDTRSNSRRAYLKAEVVTIRGRAKPVRRGARWRELSGLLAAKHPDLAAFIAAPSTKLVLVSVERCYHVSAFQTVTEWRPTG